MLLTAAIAIWVILVFLIVILCRMAADADRRERSSVARSSGSAAHTLRSPEPAASADPAPSEEYLSGARRPDRPRVPDD